MSKSSPPRVKLAEDDRETVAERKDDTLNPDVERWFETRKQEVLRIDLETAEVISARRYLADLVDPFGMHRDSRDGDLRDEDLRDELKLLCRVYFARNPGSAIWVCFDDPPDEIREKLEARNEDQVARPMSLPCTRGAASGFTAGAAECAESAPATYPSANSVPEYSIRPASLRITALCLSRTTPAL